MTEIRPSDPPQVVEGEHASAVDSLINGDPIDILHVDDDSQFLYLLKELLETSDRSFNVHSSSSAEEALEMLKRRRFDFIISDYMMPGMKGIEFAQLVRRNWDTPLIIYTGHGTAELAERAYQAGVDDFMSKSLDSAGIRTLSKRILMMVGNHRAGLALRESEERYKSIMENSLSGVLIARFAEPHLVFVNQTLAEMLGYTVDEMIGFNERQVLGLVHEDDRETLYKSFEESFKGKHPPVRFKCRVYRKDRTVILLEMSSNIVVYKGEPAVQATFLDVTEKEEEDRTLMESEEMYRSLFKLLPDGIITFDLRGFITSANPAHFRITGFKEEQIIGRHFTKVGAARVRDIPKYLEVFTAARAVRGEHPPPIEFPIIHSDGSLRLGEAHYALIKVRGKREAIAIARNITDRRNADEKLKVVGKLARHEVRNKMSIIGGYISLHKMKENEEKVVKESVKEINKAMDHISMIMDFAADTRGLAAKRRSRKTSQRVLNPPAPCSLSGRYTWRTGAWGLRS